jgi:hypothetical protein
MKVPEGYVAFIEELPGANTQGETLEEAGENLTEPLPWFWRRTASWRNRWWERKSSGRRLCCRRHEARRSHPASGAARL